MSKTVDERVVSMQFDNKHFESNVQTTLSTLDKLKQSLKLDGATKGLEGVDSAAKKINLSPLGNAVETVGAKFSAMQVMAVTALANITNSAVNAGKRMVSALTIDPIKTGFSEYETQINAVQTILANTESKGTTLQQVNSALDTLNTYADKTIYNFTEMTKNIGTFTAAGVDLDTSVQAIQGIANLAAVSGSTSQQASTAMYQLSQALSSGTVKLMDWNSVVNAGMGGQVFQDALKETARNHGVAIDQMIKKQGSFRETLQEGWLTSEILTETLSHFTMAAEEGTQEWEAYKKSLMDQGYTEKQAAEIIKLSNTATNAATKVKTFTQLWDTLKESAQSGWTQTWEIIVGDFEEAKGFLTEVSDKIGGMIGASAEARNAVLSEGLSSGWKQLLGAGIADEAGYKETFAEVAKARNVSIDEMVEAEKKLDSSLSDTEAYQKALKKGLTEGTLSADMMSESVHKMADKMSKMSAEELKAAGYTQDHVKQIKDLSAGLKDGTVSMDDFVKKITRTSGRENIIQALWNAFDGLMSVVEPIKQAFGEIFDPITGEQVYSFTEALVNFTEKLTLSGEQSENLKRTFKGVFAIFDIGVQLIKAVAGGFFDLIGYVAPAGNGILGFTANIGDFLVKLRDAIVAGDVFGKIVKKIGDFLKPIAEGIKEFGKSISTTFTEITSKAEVRFSPLTAMGNALKAIFVGIGKVVAKAMPLIVGLAKGIGSIFTSLMERISESISGADYSKLFDILNGGIFSAIGILIARFIKSGGDILDNAGGILENIKDIIGGAGDALEAFTQQLKAKTLGEIAKAIAILAAALFVISLIDSEKLAASLGSVTLMFGELMGGLSILSKTTDGVNVLKLGAMGGVLKKIASALLILAIAMKIMGSMSWKEMGVGLISMTVGLGALVCAVNLLPEGDVNAAAKSIKKLSSAMVVLAIALKIMGSMSWKEMGVGLISMTAGLGLMVAAVKLLPKDTSKRASGIFGLSVAMVALGAALKIMGSMSWKEMGVSLISMATGLGLMVAAVKLLPKDAAIKTLGIIGLASALVIMASALKIMGSMSWQEMGISLISMAVALGALVLAVRGMPKDVVTKAAGMFILSSALVALAIAVKTMGSMSWEEVIRGLVTLGGALLIMGLAAHFIGPLAPAMLALGGAIALIGIGVLAAGVGVAVFAAGLTALAAALAVSGGAIVTFVAAVIGLIPFLIEQIGIGIIKFCEVIAGSADAICSAITVIVLAVVDALVTAIPAIAEGALKLIVGLLEILIEYVPQIVPLLVKLLVTLIDSIVEYLPEITPAIFRLLVALIDNIASNISELIAPLVNLFGIIFQGIADVIGPVIKSVIAPILTILKDLIVGIVEAIAPYLPTITSCFTIMTQVICDAIVKIVEALAPFMPEIQKMVDSVTRGVEAIVNAIVALAEQIAPVIHEIAGLVEEVGTAIENIFNGIADVVRSVGDSIKSVLDGIAGVFEAIGEAALNAGTGFEKMANGVKTITQLSLADMAASLAAVATGLGKIAAHSKGISSTGDGMKKIADSVKTSESAFDNMSSGITAVTGALVALGPIASVAMSEFTTALTKATSSLSKISADVLSATTSIRGSIVSMGTACAATIQSFNGRFADAGRYLISGLASGILANKPVAVAAARNVASAVESTIRSAWQVNSPSKVFYGIALGVGEGIENAFGDSTLGVERSAKDLANTTTGGFSNAIAKLADFVSSDIDAQPTIRPVLDLSDVKAGASAIGGMFSDRTLSVNAQTAGIVSASMSGRQNGNGSSDIVSAIKALRKDISDMPRENVNINGITYSGDSEINDAVQTLVRATIMKGRT